MLLQLGTTKKEGTGTHQHFLAPMVLSDSISFLVLMAKQKNIQCTEKRACKLNILSIKAVVFKESFS